MHGPQSVRVVATVAVQPPVRSLGKVTRFFPGVATESAVTLDEPAALAVRPSLPLHVRVVRELLHDSRLLPKVLSGHNEVSWRILFEAVRDARKKQLSVHLRFDGCFDPNLFLGVEVGDDDGKSLHRLGGFPGIVSGADGISASGGSVPTSASIRLAAKVRARAWRPTSAFKEHFHSGNDSPKI